MILIVLTIVLVWMVITAILLLTEDVTVAEPRPELSCVNLLESCNSLLLNFKDVISPFAPLTSQN